MPYELKKVKHGYDVVNQNTHKPMEHHPISHEEAVKQMRALYMHDPQAHAEAMKQHMAKSVSGPVHQNKG